MSWRTNASWWALKLRKYSVFSLYLVLSGHTRIKYLQICQDELRAWLPMKPQRSLLGSFHPSYHIPPMHELTRTRFAMPWLILNEWYMHETLYEGPLHWIRVVCSWLRTRWPAVELLVVGLENTLYLPPPGLVASPCILSSGHF